MSAGAITISSPMRVRSGKSESMNTDQSAFAVRHGSFSRPRAHSKGAVRASLETGRRVVTAILVLGAIAGGAAGAISICAAQGADSDAAYVEAVTGRVIASSEGNPTLLDVLDIIGDRTRLDLAANSELRICHYRTGKLVTLRGPLRASVSMSGVAAENGRELDSSAGTCAAPVVSIFQGGAVYRGLEPMKAANVSVRPSIKVVNSGSKTIRRVALWDGARQKMLTTFDRTVGRPMLADGQSYILVIECSDGSEVTLQLAASAAVRTGPLIVLVR